VLTVKILLARVHTHTHTHNLSSHSPPLSFRALRRRFQTRNPSIAAFDHGKAAVRKGGFSKIEEGFPTVTRQFIEQQMAAMRSGLPEEAAYAATRGWLLGNGPRLFQHLSVPKAIKKVAVQTPASLGALRLVNEAALAQQVQSLRELLAAKEEERGEAGKGGRLGAGVKAGVLGSKEGAVKEAVQRRAMSRDLELPRRPVNVGAAPLR
jgi:hypothetical protein